jgi:hypothetical protein
MFPKGFFFMTDDGINGTERAKSIDINKEKEVRFGKN